MGDAARGCFREVSAVAPGQQCPRKESSKLVPGLPVLSRITERVGETALWPPVIKLILSAQDAGNAWVSVFEPQFLSPVKVV